MSNMIFVSIELLSEEALKSKYDIDKPKRKYQTGY